MWEFFSTKKWIAYAYSTVYVTFLPINYSWIAFVRQSLCSFISSRSYVYCTVHAIIGRNLQFLLRIKIQYENEFSPFGNKSPLKIVFCVWNSTRWKPFTLFMYVKRIFSLWITIHNKKASIIRADQWWWCIKFQWFWEIRETQKKIQHQLIEIVQCIIHTIYSRKKSVHLCIRNRIFHTIMLCVRLCFVYRFSIHTHSLFLQHLFSPVAFAISYGFG